MMPHHKRRRPKNRRGGCLMCKSWKINGYRTEKEEGERFSDHRRRVSAQIEIAQYFVADTAIPATCYSCHATVGVIEIGPEEDCDFMCEECLSVGMVDA